MRRFIMLAAGAALAALGTARAETGVSADAIVFGQAAVLQGPASALGLGMKEGLEAAFQEANRKGGVHGRQLKLISVDDGYEPAKSMAATRKLIEDDKVFALIGPVGTPTAVAAQPIAAAANVPFIGAFTGASFLRNPNLENVINVRASYDAETEAWVKHLTEDLKLERIAIFYQDDAFGRAGLSGFEKAMKKRGLPILAEGSYERNTTAVKTALLALRKAQPEAVVMVGAYQPCAEFIKLARSIEFSPVFVNISFVGASALAKALGKEGAGVIVSQVVPFPWDASTKVIADYHAAIKARDPKAEPEFVSLEGYLVGRLAIAALERAGSEPTRAGLLKAIKEGGAFDIGGLQMSFGPNDNEGLDKVFMTVIAPDGSFKAVDRLTQMLAH
ncbi:ABC transporter substrate-binding protein [Pseudorhodoplanes sp.]|uniref:ABC transporter substrate-binding protein n=1 Tax=Pseudorhodoplanes sp. TaxID=1934341 RepID=UPI00391D98C4